ncbi:RDD family protein [Brachybacterium sp. AOP3-A1-3]|uniref:RDD family protein n=1 Tax=Brachybacterium sp. AOP3-A1-3 TaxID=3457699 RepID=UPI004034F5AC
MHRLARRRATGYLCDCAGYLGVAAAMVPFGLAVNALTDLGRSRTYAYTVSVVPPAIATVIAARAESGPRRATWGKRRVGLQVEDMAGGGRITLERALARNALKILVPWQAGHITAIAAIWGGFEEGDRVAYVATVLVYGLMAAEAVTCLRGGSSGNGSRSGSGSGRGPHDLLGRSVVVDVSSPASVSSPATVSSAATAPRSR